MGVQSVVGVGKRARGGASHSRVLAPQRSPKVIVSAAGRFAQGGAPDSLHGVLGRAGGNKGNKMFTFCFGGEGMLEL